MLKNQLLQSAHDKIVEGVSPKNRPFFDRLFKSATAAVFDDSVFSQIAQQLAQSKDPAGDVAKGVVSIMNMLAHKARGTIPHDVFLQASMCLMLEGLDFIEQAGQLQVTNEVLVTATKDLIEALLPTVGLNAQKLSDLLGGVQQTATDPQKMGAFQQAMQGEAPPQGEGAGNGAV